MFFTRPSGRARGRCVMTSEPLERRALLSASPIAVAADASADVVPVALAVQADGKLVAVGTTNVNGTNDFVVARYNADGTVDTTFGLAGRVITDFDFGDDRPVDVAVLCDGRILVGGQGAWQAPGGYTYALARYLPDGSLDPTFDGDGKARRPGLATNAMALAPDGKIVLAGGTSTPNFGDFAVVRLNADGSPDTGFGAGGLATFGGLAWGEVAWAVDVQGDGKVVVGGRREIPPPPFSHGIPPAVVGVIGRLNTDGSPDPSLGPTGIVQNDFNPVRQLTVAPDGKVLFSAAGSDGDVVICRLDSGLSPDNSFAYYSRYTFDLAGGTPRALELMPDGKVLVAMNDHVGAAYPRALVASLTPDGAPDATFGGGDGVATLPTDETFAALADVVVQPSGRIVALGTGLFDAHKDFSLAALTGAGEPDPTFLFAQTASAHITRAWVGSSEWSPAFRQALASSDSDDTVAYGHSVLDGGPGPQSPLPWINLNQVALRFDRALPWLGRGDLLARGVNVPAYAVSDFRYDANTATAVWTLGGPLGADRVTFELTPSKFRGAQPVRVDVLPGDVDQGGQVVAADASAVKRSFFRSTTNPGTGDDAYSPLRDVNGSGAILADDFSAVKQRFFTRLPEDDGAAALVAAPSATGILRDA